MESLRGEKYRKATTILNSSQAFVRSVAQSFQKPAQQSLRTQLSSSRSRHYSSNHSSGVMPRAARHRHLLFKLTETQSLKLTETIWHLLLPEQNQNKSQSSCRQYSSKNQTHKNQDRSFGTKNSYDKWLIARDSTESTVEAADRNYKEPLSQRYLVALDPQDAAASLVSSFHCHRSESLGASHPGFNSLGRSYKSSAVFPAPTATFSYRLVIDLSHINELILCPTFKLADILKLRHALPKHARLASIDLSDAFLHVPMHPRFQNFPVFTHNNNMYQINPHHSAWTSAPISSPWYQRHPCKFFTTKESMPRYISTTGYYGPNQRQSVAEQSTEQWSCSTTCPVKLFRRRMQNYAILCDKIIQHYATLYNPQRIFAALLPWMTVFAAITVHNLIGM